MRYVGDDNLISALASYLLYFRCITTINFQRTGFLLKSFPIPDRVFGFLNLAPLSD